MLRYYRYTYSFTLTNIAGDVGHIRDLIRYVAFTIIPFALSAMGILMTGAGSTGPRLKRAILVISV